MAPGSLIAAQPRTARNRQPSPGMSREFGLLDFAQDPLNLARVAGEDKVDDGDLGLPAERDRIGFDPVPDLMWIKQGADEPVLVDWHHDMRPGPSAGPQAKSGKRL
jgi:hypothetical protein